MPTFLSMAAENQAGLARYDAFRAAVLDWCGRAASLDELSRRLKEDRELKRLREGARAELQTLYEGIRRQFGMRAVPVHLPLRKTVSVRGRAVALEVPQEIRIYAIKGSRKPYRRWTPRDVGCDTVESVMETLLHESAHVLDYERNRRMAHERTWVDAYEEIELWLQNRGYAPLLPRAERMTGCPRGSYAGRIARRYHRFLRERSTSVPEGAAP